MRRSALLSLSGWCRRLWTQSWSSFSLYVAFYITSVWPDDFAATRDEISAPVNGLRQRRRVRDRQFVIEPPPVFTNREPFECFDRRALRNADAVEVGVVDSRRFDDQRVFLPAADGVA